MGPPTGRAKIEYLAAQELEAQTKPNEELRHYKLAANLQQYSSFLWKALGQAEIRAGDFQAAKLAFAKAYWSAPEGGRAKIKLYNGLTDNDLGRVTP